MKEKRESNERSMRLRNEKKQYVSVIVSKVLYMRCIC